VRARWVATLLLTGIAATAAAAAPRIVAPVAPGVEAVLDSDFEIHLRAQPLNGDAWTRLSLRITGDAAQWKDLAALNRMGPNLMTDRKVRVPLSRAKPELQRRALEALFPKDRADASGWTHVVSAGGGVEGESLWKIAEWFTGNGANYAAIRDANRWEKLSTRRGDEVFIPAVLLAPPFRSATPAGKLAAAAHPPTRSAARDAEDDPDDGDVVTVSHAAVELAARSGPIALEYVKNAPVPYAVYRLRKGEALYSSVAIRFTGRLFAKDVNDVVAQIVEFNTISDVAKLPVGYPVKMPLELLMPQFRPPDDAKRVEYERAKKESDRLSAPVVAKNLERVHVIIDAGHGGRDVGTAHDGVWESVYAYDIAVRLKAILEKRSDATVWMTTKSVSNSYAIPDRNTLKNVTDHVVLTSPRYRLDDPVIGVNLRWYLANSVYRRAMEKKVPADRVIFISIHADSLHPSLRGAMAYIPGERHAQGTFKKSGQVYLARAEVRESPTVTLSKSEALRAEGLSRDLARSIIASFANLDLKVHPYEPVRDNVVRGGREWVPAVIRYNKVPSRVLLEVCNLGNADDRKLMQTKAYRQTVARAIYEGIVRHFEGEGGEPSSPNLLKTAAR
jgi:N-acetylmuramoyl-L-alanine amidase